MMKKDLKKSLDFADIYEIIEGFPRKVVDERRLFQFASMTRFKVTTPQLIHLRSIRRQEVEESMDKLYFMKEEYKGTYQRLKFLNKFYLYSEITKQFSD